MTLLLFIFILSILVLVHELGHFLAARRVGIKVEEFAFGLPFTKPVFSRKKGETVYSIYPLIFGGFVKLYGEDGAASTEVSASQGRAYYEKSIVKRTLVLLAGVCMNLLLALICFSVLYFVWGIPTKTGKVIVEDILEGSPAQAAQLKPKDWIVSVEGKTIKESSQLIGIATEKAGEEMEMEIAREDQSFIVKLVPRVNPPEGEGPLGVVITDSEFKKYPFYLMPFLGVREGFKESFSWGKMVLGSLGKMFSSLLLQGKVPKDIAGPIGIYQITGQAAKAGWLAVLQLLGIISVNLAIVNVLPIPAMDGGRLVFLLYEGVFRKKAPAKFEQMVNQIGMIFLLALMGLITFGDITRLIK